MIPTEPGWYWINAKAIWAGATWIHPDLNACFAKVVKVEVKLVDGHLVVDRPGAAGWEYIVCYGKDTADWLGTAD